MAKKVEIVGAAIVITDTVTATQLGVNRIYLETDY
jgi:hypothetical protein